MNTLRASTVRFVASGIVFCVLAAGGVHLWEANVQDSLLERSQGDPRILAELLIERDVGRALQCSLVRAGRAPDDFDVLMSAIATVERFATSTLERIAEAALLRGSVLLGLHAPDLSIGDAQIRISTALKALQAQQPLEHTQHFDWNAVALSLLAPCANHQLGARVLHWIAKQRGQSPHALDRASILAIAAAYNGQTQPRALPDFIAKNTYNELVYHVYHAIKFALLRQNLPSDRRQISAIVAR